jgi:hypothetical protein
MTTEIILCDVADPVHSIFFEHQLDLPAKLGLYFALAGRFDEKSRSRPFAINTNR